MQGQNDQIYISKHFDIIRFWSGGCICCWRRLEEGGVLDSGSRVKYLCYILGGNMKKTHKEKIKQLLCGLTVHRYRKMHFKHKKTTKEYVYVFKCIRCGKIKTLKKPAVRHVRYINGGLR